MNGVLRGGYFSTVQMFNNRSGKRDVRSIQLSDGARGFRLNGVIRGGRWISMSPMLHRCSYRVSRPKTDVDGQYMGLSTIGFL